MGRVGNRVIQRLRMRHEVTGWLAGTVRRSTRHWLGPPDTLT